MGLGPPAHGALLARLQRGGGADGRCEWRGPSVRALTPECVLESSLGTE